MHDPRVSAALSDLAPIIRREASRLHRKLPASIELDDVEQAARIAAWQAAQDFNGGGSLEAFATQRIRQRLIDFQRETHPAGRSGKKIIGVSDDDAMELVASDDDPAAAVEMAQEFEAQMKKFAPDDRKKIERALAGKPVTGLSAGKVAAMLEGKRNRTPDTFDPDSVPVLMGLQVPAKVKATRPGKFQRLLARLPAGGAYELGKVQAASLASEAKKRGVRYILRPKPNSETTMLFFREPTEKQLKGT